MICKRCREAKEPAELKGGFGRCADCRAHIRAVFRDFRRVQKERIEANRRAFISEIHASQRPFRIGSESNVQWIRSGELVRDVAFVIRQLESK